MRHRIFFFLFSVGFSLFYSPVLFAEERNYENISENILGIPSADLRAGDVGLGSISFAIVNIIEVLISIAGTIAIFSLIYHAVQMQLKSGITGDSSGVESAKKGMISAGIGFVIAILAWFIVTRAVELLSAVS